jgi:hypothetical protein
MPPHNENSAKVLVSKDFVAARCFTLPQNKDVWSWHPDADAKFAWRSRRAGDGGQKARRTGESTYKP